MSVKTYSQGKLSAGRYNKTSAATGYATQTVALLHFDGADGSTTITDSSVKASNWTANGNAKLSTAKSKFGSASLILDGSGDWISSSSSDLAFSSDFTVEMWVYPTGSLNDLDWYDSRGSSYGTGIAWTVESGIMRVYGAPGKIIDEGGTSLTANVWQHIALCRSGSTVRLFRNGTQLGSSGTDSTSYPANAGTSIGANPSGAASLAGYIDEVRIVRAAVYTSNFTVPSAAFG